MFYSRRTIRERKRRVYRFYCLLSVFILVSVRRASAVAIVAVGNQPPIYDDNNSHPNHNFHTSHTLHLRNNNNNNNKKMMMNSSSSTSPMSSFTIVIQNLQKQKGLATKLIHKYHPDLLLLQEINRFSEEDNINEEGDNNTNNKLLSFYDRVYFTSEKRGYGTAIYGKKKTKTKQSMRNTTNTNTNNITNMRMNSAEDVTSSTTTTLTNLLRIESPHAEVGGWIVKKTMIATYQAGSSNTTIPNDKNNEDEDDDENENDTSTTSSSNKEILLQVISFHGYNGQPFKNVTKLVDHVKAVISAIEATTTTTTTATIFAGDFNTWTKNHFEAVQTVLNQVGFRWVYSWPYPGREFPLDHIFIREDGSSGDISRTRTTSTTTTKIHVNNTSSFENESDHRGALLEVTISTVTPTTTNTGV